MMHLWRRLLRTSRQARWTRLSTAPMTLAESPRWLDSAGLLAWLDISAGTLHTRRLASGSDNSFRLGEEAAPLELRPDGTLMVGRGDRLDIVDPTSGGTSGFARVPSLDGDAVRLNDAGVASDGSIWVTSMSRDGTAPLGALLRVGTDARVQLLQDDLVIGNGPAFDHRRGLAYLADSARRVIYRVQEATPGEREPFVRFATSDGYPDGMLVDDGGNLWVAHHSGAQLSVWSPSGTRRHGFPTPFRNPTALAFLPAPAGTIRCAVTSAADERGNTGALWQLEAPALPA